MHRRTFVSLPLAAALPLRGAGRIAAFQQQWDVPLEADWRAGQEDGEEVLSLLTARPANAQPRRPFQYALLAAPPPDRFTLEVEVQRQRGAAAGSLIIVYAWRDFGYFNYVHLSNDTGTEQPVHNGVFHVYGGDRVRISPTPGPGSLPTGGWHRVKMTYDAAAGLVETWVDGVANPALRAVDLSLGAGRVGLGSFFNTGAFRRFRLAAA